MVDTVFPADAVAGAPAYSGRKLRQVLSALLSGATSARPLGGRSGVRPGTPSSTVTATSSTWTVQPFAGVADFETAVEAGPYEFAFDAVATGAMTAAAVGLSRKDIVYVQGDDPAESDGTSTPAIRRGYLAGVAGSGVPPATPARSFVIAEINVPASGGGSPTVTWKAPYTVAAGGILPCPNGSSDYPASPYVDQVISDGVLGVLLKWSGSAWQAVGAGYVTGLTVAGVGGSASQAADGVISFSACTAVTIDGLGTKFGYEIIWDVTATSAPVTPYVKLRAASADISSANYDAENHYGISAADAASFPTAQTTGWQLNIAGSIFNGALKLFGLGATRAKIGRGLHYGTQNPQTAPGLFSTGNQFRLTTTITGVSLIFTGGGNATGTIRIKEV